MNYQTNKIGIILEIVAVFLAAFIIIQILTPLAGDNLIWQQAAIWFANVIMLLMVWAGMKWRGESWQDFGLSMEVSSWKKGLWVWGQSLVVFVLATGAFVLGVILMSQISAAPEQADMSAYAYLKDNPMMLVLSLLGVYIVSSFGEEFVYRAFLIRRLSSLGPPNRITTVFAVLISSVFFGFAHYAWGPVGIVQTTLMGLVLGASYVYCKRNLWVNVLAHAYMDTILMLQLYFA